MRAMAKKLSDELNEEGKYVLTQGERMEMMLYVADLHDRADEYDKKLKEAIRIEIEKMKLSPQEINDLVVEGVQIKMSRALTNTIKPYNSRQKFSLATFEKSYVQGKVDRAIKEADSKIYRWEVK